MQDQNNELRGLRPAGYHFNPTDLELIKDYLFKMVYGNPPLSTVDVFNIDGYGDSEWRTYFEFFKDDDTLYFFTRLETMPTNRSRIRRVAENGKWKNQHRPTLIIDDYDKKLIGSKSNFTFIPKVNVPEPRDKWVMHEFRLKGQYENNECAIWRIRKMGTNGGAAAYANQLL
ncbi:hypothetical protein EZV62_006290 [Acer yangbiense]|uniref:NAC domain-containing protein n=1 Tax=Acer yangbiense TaxID=1000413 RepID=A0A5C7IQ26_9ROSI|nr:hypothetical protein EZV62_006290 [Acer yangbiense]